MFIVDGGYLPQPSSPRKNAFEQKYYLNFEGATGDGSRAEALGQRLQWWLHQWAGWPPPPRLRLTKVRWFYVFDRDALCIEWLRSDGLVLNCYIDGMVLNEQRRQGHSDPTAVARRLAYERLRPLLARSPWEIAHA